jgi:hypothetical protein
LWILTGFTAKKRKEFLLTNKKCPKSSIVSNWYATNGLSNDNFAANIQKNLLSNLGLFSIVRINALVLVRAVNCFHTMEAHKTKRKIKSNQPINRRNMKIQKWTLGLAAVGLVTLAPAVLAQTAPQNTPLLTSLSATTISGYVDTSAVWNPGTGNANPAPYAFNAGKSDGFNLDQIDIKLSKPIEEGKWSAGYVAELTYGPDATGIDAGAYPIRQAYVDLNVPVGNGIELKMGRWDNIIGYETSDSVNNPNFTRSYGYSFEPTEHTGLLAAYKFADWINVQVGAADTLTTFGGVNSRNAGIPAGAYASESKKTVVSLVTLTAPDSWGFLKGSALYGGFDHGQGAFSHDTTEYYAGATINTPVKDLSVGAAFDSIQHVDVAGFDAGYFKSIAGYVSYKLTDKATVNGRVEWATGSPIGANADANNSPFGYAGGTPANPVNAVLALTGTFQYDLWANVVSRLEVRWDHAAGGGAGFGGTEPIGGAFAVTDSKVNEVMIAANVIYKF